MPADSKLFVLKNNIYNQYLADRGSRNPWTKDINMARFFKEYKETDVGYDYYKQEFAAAKFIAYEHAVGCNMEDFELIEVCLTVSYE